MKIDEKLIALEVKHIWENMFPLPHTRLIGNQLTIGSQTMKLGKTDYDMTLDDFSERIIMPMIGAHNNK